MACTIKTVGSTHSYRSLEVMWLLRSIVPCPTSYRNELTAFLWEAECQECSRCSYVGRRIQRSQEDDVPGSAERSSLFWFRFAAKQRNRGGTKRQTRRRSATKCSAPKRACWFVSSSGGRSTGTCSRWDGPRPQAKVVRKEGKGSTFERFGEPPTGAENDDTGGCANEYLSVGDHQCDEFIV